MFEDGLRHVFGQEVGDVLFPGYPMYGQLLVQHLFSGEMHRHAYVSELRLMSMFLTVNYRCPVIAVDFGG